MTLLSLNLWVLGWILMHYYLARGNVFNGNALEITEIGMLSRSVALLGLVDVLAF